MDLLTANDQQGEYPASWYASVTDKLDKFPAVTGDIKCDVCIVGGGFTGLSSALHLAQKGYNVVLLEAQRIGFGASGRNGGQAGTGQRVDQDELEGMVGKETARELWKISLEAVDMVRELSKSRHVECHFHSGIIHADHRKRFVKDSLEYAQKLQDDYDHGAIRGLEQEEIRSLVKSNAYYGGTLDTYAGHINPLGFAIGLARMALEAGATVFENSKVVKITEGTKISIETDKANIIADHAILACNGYLGSLNNEVASRVMPINNYVVATAPMSPEKQEEIIRNNYAVADSKFVVNYFRFSEDHRLLFGGTESYGYRFPTDIASAVRKPMAGIFPQLADIPIEYAWGGTLAITMNRMPYFERLSSNIYSFSGYSGHGLALATFAGKIASEVISGQSEKFDIMAKVPTPRFPGGVALRNPLLVLAMLWYSFRDRF